MGFRMDELLKYLGLRAFIRLEFPVSQEEFYLRFERMVDEETVAIFPSDSEEPPERQNKYVGEVNLDSFKISRQGRFQIRRIYSPEITGKIKPEGASVIAEITIDGFYRRNKFHLAVSVLGISLPFAYFRSIGNKSLTFTEYLFLLLFSLFGFTFWMRRVVILETLDIEREIHYALSKKM